MCRSYHLGALIIKSIYIDFPLSQYSHNLEQAALPLKIRFLETLGCWLDYEFFESILVSSAF